VTNVSTVPCANHSIKQLQCSLKGLFSGTTWSSQHKKGKQFWILMKHEMMEWLWHQLDHIQITAQQSYLCSEVVHHKEVNKEVRKISLVSLS